MLWFRNWKSRWRARKKIYHLGLEKSLIGLNPAAVSPEEKAAIVATAEAVKVETFKLLRRSEFEREFSPKIPIASGEQIYFPGARLKHKFSGQKDSRGECFDQKEWLLAMPSNFRKCIQNIDGKLQGRILQAISEICQNPMTPRGNTVQPLTRDLHGFWRYRISQFRLLYQPVPELREIILVTFESRASVYD